uniref:Uncharacterized protein n=1 Tax=Anopheles atroparvus TaxID=41427 RepID=A0A182JF98_ANOAO
MFATTIVPHQTVDRLAQLLRLQEPFRAAAIVRTLPASSRLLLMRRRLRLLIRRRYSATIVHLPRVDHLTVDESVRIGELLLLRWLLLLMLRMLLVLLVPPTDLHVVELATVKLKELDQQHAEIGKSVRLSVVLLQKAYAHQDQRVGRDAAGEYFVQVALQQELLQHQHQLFQHRIVTLVALYKLGRLHARLHVERNVHLDLRLPVGQLHDRHGRLVQHPDGVGFRNALVDQLHLEGP